jgi:very-short-patch-repair endonuclease
MSTLGKVMPQQGISRIKPGLRKRVGNNTSTPADELAFQLLSVKTQFFEREFQIVPDRRYRADFFFIRARLIVEVDGGGWVNGRHSRGYGIENDAEKSALIARMPARLMRVTPKQIKDGRALDWILKALTV